MTYELNTWRNLMDILLSERFRKMIKQSNLRITMSQLGEMTGVSPSQIRYWEKKGYINSEPVSYTHLTLPTN